jgi:hypothetical protein
MNVGLMARKATEIEEAFAQIISGSGARADAA